MGTGPQHLGPQGHRPQHLAPQGHGPQHLAPQGHRPQHLAPQGHRPQHLAPQGHRPQHLAPQGHRPQHLAPQGHRPQHLAPQGHRPQHLAIDIGGTHLRLALCSDDRSEILWKKKQPLEGRAVEAVFDTIETALDSEGHSKAPITTCGLAIAGQIDSQSGGLIHAPNLDWRDRDIAQELALRLDAKVLLVNDVNAITLAEARWARHQPVDDMLCVFLGTGLGMGAMVGGSLLEGAHGIAAELGHAKVLSDTPGKQPLCGCGARGCIEAYTSGAHLPARYALFATTGGADAEDVLKGSKQPIDATWLERAALDGDKAAKELWRESARLLGTCIASAVAVLDPSVLVLGGGVFDAAPSLVAQVSERVLAQSPKPHAERLRIETSRLGDDAGVLGACLVR